MGCQGAVEGWYLPEERGNVEERLSCSVNQPHLVTRPSVQRVTVEGQINRKRFLFPQCITEGKGDALGFKNSLLPLF